MFILKMCELCSDGYEAPASKAKARLEPSLSSLVSSFPEWIFQSGGLGAERQLRSFEFKIRVSQRSVATGPNTS